MVRASVVTSTHGLLALLIMSLMLTELVRHRWIYYVTTWLLRQPASSNYTRCIDWQKQKLLLNPSGAVAHSGGDGASAPPFGLTVNFWIIFALFL